MTETETKDRTEGAEKIEAPARAELAHYQRPAQDALRDVFEMPDEQREAIARFLNIEATDPALPAYLAICNAYNLSPFLGEIWLIEQKVKIRDAEGRKTDGTRLKPTAGRDGFLSIAQKSGVFEGITGDVVCANDTFEVDWAVDRHDAPKVMHRHAPMVKGADVSPRDYRGPIIGAWAKGYRRDTVPFFYFAPLKEHGKTGTNSNTGAVYWQGAWSYTSGMILKAAMSYVLRILFSITGVVPSDELRADITLGVDETQALSATDDPVAAIPDEVTGELRDRLTTALAASAELDPFAWPSAKVEMVFTNRSPEEVERILLGIEVENGRLAAKLEEQAAASDTDTAADPEEVADAEVVPEPGQAGEDPRLSQLADLTAALEDEKDPVKVAAYEKQAKGLRDALAADAAGQ